MSSLPRLRLLGRGVRYPTTTTTSTSTAFRIAQQRLNSTTPGTEKGTKKKNFRSQLYDSTARRIVSEKTQQTQRVATGKATGARPERVSSSTLSAVFGATAIAIGFYLLGQGSLPSLPTSSTTPLDTLAPPEHNVSKANLEASWAEFVALLGQEHVKTSADELQRHATSAWSSHHTKTRDLFLIVYPNTTEEVSGIAKICHERKIPMTPYSGGTSLEGHFAPTRGGVCIDFSRMDRVLSLHAADLDVVVQPAVGWEQLNIDLAPHGLFFPPDPGPGAMIGGMVGTGCSGTNAARYGTMREWVLSLTVVLADGTVVKTRQRPRKSSAGYDLTKLFIGSEGTLGLVTEATLKLAPVLPHTSVAVVSFASIAAAARTVAAVATSGAQLAAIELLDDVQMKCINAAGGTSRAWSEAPTLFLKFAGTQAAVKEQIALVKSLAKTEGSRSFEFAKNDAEAAELWSARKEALWSVMALKRHEGDKVWTTDVAVPLSSLSLIIEETQRDIERSGLLGAIVGHVGDGNFHSILLFGREEQEVAEGVVKRMVHRAIELEGTVTGEHGVGLVKRDYLAQEIGVAGVDLMRRVKMAMDPGCLLNCDKVVRVERGH